MSEHTHKVLLALVLAFIFGLAPACVGPEASTTPSIQEIDSALSTYQHNLLKTTSHPTPTRFPSWVVDLASFKQVEIAEECDLLSDDEIKGITNRRIIQITWETTVSSNNTIARYAEEWVFYKQNNGWKTEGRHQGNSCKGEG